MSAIEIAAQLVKDLENLYQYQGGRWLYRRSKGWHYAEWNGPRQEIWQAMYQRQRSGVVPSNALANEIQQYLERGLTPKRSSCKFQLSS